MQGICIISGGARGIDQIAMGAALEAGGMVVGVMADSLLRTSLRQEVREAVRIQRLALVSPYYPEAGWNVGNAMNRNKCIYALSDYALVVIADYQKGGTWEGAVEELRRDNHVPLFVRLHENMPKGNRELIKKGGLPFPGQPWEKPLPELLAEAARGASVSVAAIQQDLFTIAKQEKVPVVSEPTIEAMKPDRPCIGKSLPKISARTDFENALLVLQSALRQPRTVTDLSAELDVQKTQLNRWLKEASKRGLIKKMAKPTRYVVIPNVEQSSLFREKDANETQIPKFGGEI
jgi:predicted Rossmann fold nucleotide-binding protein DprA/Smf involved in DNA uptake